MNVNSTGSMQYAHMGSMDGTGLGQGKGGSMREIMDQLPESEKAAFREKMQSMSNVERKDAIAQMKEIDTSSMSPDEASTSLLSVLFPEEYGNNTSTSDSTFDMYA